MAEQEPRGSGEPIKHYKDLLVYQQAYRAALTVSKLTRTFPRSEQFELAHQMRTAARSIPANLAEVGHDGSRLQSSVGFCKWQSVRVKKSKSGWISAVTKDT